MYTLQTRCFYPITSMVLKIVRTGTVYTKETIKHSAAFISVASCS